MENDLLDALLDLLSAMAMLNQPNNQPTFISIFSSIVSSFTHKSSFASHNEISSDAPYIYIYLLIPTGETFNGALFAGHSQYRINELNLTFRESNSFITIYGSFSRVYRSTNRFVSSAWRSQLKEDWKLLRYST